MSFVFTATKKETNGKGVSRRLRHNGQIPAIIYGGNAEPVAIVMSHDDVFNAQQKTEFYSSELVIDVNGQKETVKVQAIQRHAFKPKLLHVDFKRI